MRSNLRFAAVALAAAGAPVAAAPAVADVSCGQAWAVPGEYYVSGDFRGRDESTKIRLSSSCRVYFEVPGVFSGGPVEASGQCVRFNFKVRGAPQTFEARWCGAFGVVPWNGREIQVKVWRSRRPEAATF
jgi:hypothetical protein